MTDCTRLSDRMPAVAHGLARWSPVDESHLAQCADCAAEWTIVREAAVSGTRGGPVARFGQDNSRGCWKRSGSPRRRASRRDSVSGWFRSRSPRRSPSCSSANGLPRRRTPRTAAATLSLLPEAEVLSDAELESVIRLIPVADPAEPGATDSLTDEELTTMLQDLEG